MIIKYSKKIQHSTGLEKSIIFGLQIYVKVL